MTDIKKETNSYSKVYGHSLNYAIEHSEVEKYKASRKLNRECKEAVEETIRQNFDGMHLKSDIVKPLVEQYGLERMMFIAANTIQQQSWDGRFSRSNKEWASKFPIEGDIMYDVDKNRELVVTSHPAVMNGFIDMFREEVLKLEKKKLFIREKSQKVHDKSTIKPSLKASLAEKKAQMAGREHGTKEKQNNQKGEERHTAL